MFKEAALTTFFGFLLFQYVRGQTTTSYWGFEQNEPTSTQNWWGENTDTGEADAGAAQPPMVTTTLPPTTVTTESSVEAAGVFPVGSDSTTEAGPVAVPEPSEGSESLANSTVAALRPLGSLLLVPVVTMILAQ